MKNKLNKKISVLLIFLLIAQVITAAAIVFAQGPGFETESDEVNAITEFEEEEAVEEEIVKESAGLTPDSPFYFVDEIIDTITIAAAEGEDKAEAAANIAAERVAEAKLMSDKNLTSETLEALSNANISSLVEGDVSPKLNELTQEKMDFIKKLLAEMDQQIPEDLSSIKALIDAQTTQADKNKIAGDLAEKIGDFCDKLAQEDYDLMLQEPRCDPEQAPDWLAEFIETDVKEREEEATKQVLKMITLCIEDPRQCDCNNIPVESHKQDCIEDSALAVRCEYEQDESACSELESKGDEFLDELPEFMREIITQRFEELIAKKSADMFKKFAPKECIEASATTREECEEIMIEKYGPPPEECMENGNFIGEDKCRAIMEEKYGPPPSECLEDGRFIGEEACESAMIASGTISQECVEDGQFIGREECEEKMKSAHGEAPEECMQDGQFIGEEECRDITTEKFSESPEECTKDGQFIGEEECSAIMTEKGMPFGPGGEGSMGGEGRINGEGRFGEKSGISKGEFPGECADLSPEECGKLMQEKFGEIMQGIPEGSMPQTLEDSPETPSSEELMKQIQALPSDMKEKTKEFSKIEKLEFMKQYESGQVGILTPKGMEFISKKELDKIKEKAGQSKDIEPDKFRDLNNEIEKLEKLKEKGKHFEEFREGLKNEDKVREEKEEQEMQGQLEEPEEQDEQQISEDSEEEIENEENIEN